MSLKGDGKILYHLKVDRGYPGPAQFSSHFRPGHSPFSSANLNEMSAEDHVSDYTDLEAGEEPTMMPARPMKKGLSKRKAGGFGKKGKVFASVDKMLQLVDAVNDVQDKKVNALIERDIEVSKRLAQREASKKHRQESKKKSLVRED